MRVARNGNRYIDHGSDEGPQEAGYFLGVVCQDLEGEGQRVDVGAVIANDAECKHDQAKLSEASQGREENLSEEATNRVIFVRSEVSGVGDGCSGDGQSKHFREAEREHQSAPNPQEDLGSARSDRLIAGIVRGVASPAGREAENRSCK